MKYQKGVGLVEVLVALVLLSIAVLGFTALQLRAVSASLEAGNNVQAMSLARDLSERMRANPEGMRKVFQSSATMNYTSSAGGDCTNAPCTFENLARFDFANVKQRATNMGMDIAVLNCPGYKAAFNRSCIYVSWGDTTPTNGSSATDCTNGTAYRVNAKCIIMEAYNYE